MRFLYSAAVLPPTMVDKYGMQDRLIKSEQDMFSTPDIDFSKSNALLIQDRENSLAYLKAALRV